jgi:tetratricopeptide (TPR) repeat protein
MLRQELEWIPLKALRKDRTERYASADSLGQDVRRYLSGEPLEAGPETSLYRFKKLVKRNKGPFIAAGFIAVSLIAGIIVSYYFAMQAISERARAQERLDRLQALVVELSGPINDSVKNLQGGMEVRKRMLNAGMQQLDLIRREAHASNDPELLHTVGRTLVSFGDLMGGPRTASHGDRTEARKHYDEAIEIYESMGEQAQGEAGLMIPWILGRKADLEVLADRPDEAIALITRSQDILRPSYGRGDVDRDRLYLASLERLGDIETEQAEQAEGLGDFETARGNRASALAYAREHQAGIEKLLIVGDGSDPKLRRDLAMTLRRAGHARSMLGESGEEDLLRSRLIFNNISQETPDDLRRRWDVGWADIYLGQLIGGLEDPARVSEAAQRYQAGALVIVAVCVAEPDSKDYRDDVLRVVSGVCDKLVGLGLHDNAKELRNRAILLLQPIVEKQPENLALAEALDSLRAVSVGSP